MNNYPFYRTVTEETQGNSPPLLSDEHPDYNPFNLPRAEDFYYGNEMFNPNLLDYGVNNDTSPENGLEDDSDLFDVLDEEDEHDEIANYAQEQILDINKSLWMLRSVLE